MYLKNSEQCRFGIIDSDGYYANGVFEICQKNQKLANEIVILSRSLGFGTSMTESIKGCWYKNEYKKGLYEKRGYRPAAE